MPWPACSAPGTLIVGSLNWRGDPGEATNGIGWRFIRYAVLAIAIPITAVLTLNGALTGEAATIIGGAMGYAFGKPDADR